jgi:hypothetical protein
MVELPKHVAANYYFTVLDILSCIKLTLSAFVGNKQSIDLKLHGSTIKIKKLICLLRHYLFPALQGPL